MLDLAVHMPAGVNRVSQNSLQTNVILRSDSSSIRFVLKCDLLIMTLSREYLVQSVGSSPGWEVNQARYLTLLRYLASSSCELGETKMD